MRSDGEKAQTDRHECVNGRTNERTTEEESGRRGEATLAAEWISLISLACGVFGPNAATDADLHPPRQQLGRREGLGHGKRGEGGGEAPETTLAHTLLLSLSLPLGRDRGDISADGLFHPRPRPPPAARALKFDRLMERTEGARLPHRMKPSRHSPSTDERSL